MSHQRRVRLRVVSRKIQPQFAERHFLSRPSSADVKRFKWRRAAGENRMICARESVAQHAETGEGSVLSLARLERIAHRGVSTSERPSIFGRYHDAEAYGVGSWRAGRAGRLGFRD